MKLNKQVKLALLLCFITIATFAQTAQRGEQNPPAPGIGIVIKRNPGGGASKMVVTNEKGEATIKINEAGNYTLSLSQTQGKSAGEPIPGLTIKLGKNPGGSQFQVTTNEKGEAELKGLERGEYTFTVEQPVAEHRGHVTLIKKNEQPDVTTHSITPTAERGEQAPPVIGVGVVVKKNPGGGASKMVVTNEKGEATIKINEAGNYTLSLSQTQGKSAGEPLMGIIVKGGKNPGGSQFQVTTNEKGEAELKGLDIGEYNLQAMQPAAAQASTDHIGHVTLIKKNGEKARTALTIGARVNYFIPISEQKTNTYPFLFLKSGQSAELDLTFVPKKGTTRYTLSAGYFFGTNDKERILSYAKEKDIPYDTYKFTKSNPSGFSLLVGPKIMLFPKSENKKLPLMWLNLNAGAMYTNQQTLQYFQGQNITPIAEVKTNSLNFIYQPSIEVNIIKTKKMFINARAGYSNFGGFSFGVSIAERDCNGMLCCRCPFPGFCNPCATESNENISK